MQLETEKLQHQLEALGNIKIAIVDDDLVIRQLVKTAFKTFQWQLDLYANGKVFIDTITEKEKQYDLIFLDLMMPELDGFGVLEYFKKNSITTPTIVFSSVSQKETILKAIAYGIRSYISKPLKPDIIKRKTAEILNSDF